MESSQECFKWGPISIHALLTEGDRLLSGDRSGQSGISIHALLTEGDLVREMLKCPLIHISIHALLTEGDHLIILSTAAKVKFQSTPSSRRATRVAVRIGRRRANFNPRPPHGGRLSAASAFFACSSFQSTPSSRRATIFSARFAQTFLFQSTPSSRRATRVWFSPETRWQNFNPRPPHGGRRMSPLMPPPECHFNPRPPHGGRQQK